ncbi:hypothetical protein Aduo_010127 [Ancylostoma duodenale]
MDSSELQDHVSGACRRKSRLLSELMCEAHQISMVQQADPGFLPHSKYASYRKQNFWGFRERECEDSRDTKWFKV